MNKSRSKRNDDGRTERVITSSHSFRRRNRTFSVPGWLAGSNCLSGVSPSHLDQMLLIHTGTNISVGRRLSLTTDRSDCIRRPTIQQRPAIPIQRETDNAPLRTVLRIMPFRRFIAGAVRWIFSLQLPRWPPQPLHAFRVDFVLIFSHPFFRWRHPTILHNLLFTFASRNRPTDWRTTLSDELPPRLFGVEL